MGLEWCHMRQSHGWSGVMRGMGWSGVMGGRGMGLAGVMGGRVILLLICHYAVILDV